MPPVPPIKASQDKKPEKPEVPEKLRPYVFHKMSLNVPASGEAQGTCPFCGSNKFYVSPVNGLFDCKSCPEEGNVYTFLRSLHMHSVEATNAKDLAMIAEERGISVDGLAGIGLCFSIIDRELLLPTWGFPTVKDGKIYSPFTGLYRWTKMKQGDGSWKRRLLVTATLQHGLFGLHDWDDAKPDVYIQEGPWDMEALRDELKQYKVVDNELEECSLNESFYATANVVGTPGCDVFRDEWISKFRHKNVFIGMDNDHPTRYKDGHAKAGEFVRHKDGSKTVAGFDGMKKLARLLYPVAKSVQIMNWGPEGYDEELPSGHDTRDFLSQA